ncbi:orexin receptor type 2-like [Tubulanus polymorphus]|uniref:orexin receptor type 2-like n=1 Tax=Tubulanus polymorphus TaxID=672921 RepID=UPI003DA4F378
MNITILTTSEVEPLEPSEYIMSPAEKYTLVAMLIFLSVLGTAGNALVVYVFSKRNDNQTSTMFIIALAVVDMMTCAVIIPFTIVMEHYRFYIGNDFLCKIYQFFVTSNVPYSALIMSGIAVDRYLCICHPFLHAMNIKRAKIVILCLGLLSAVMGVIVALAYGVYKRVAFVPCNSTDALNVINGKFDVNVTDSVAYAHIPWCRLNSTVKVETVAEPIKFEILYHGYCNANELILSEYVRKTYQKVHVASYILCLLVVVVLYALIYRSVLMRRRKRAKWRHANATTCTVNVRETSLDTEETQLTTLNGHDNNKISLNPNDDKRLKRKSTKKDKNRMQNVKTAAMLFVVTVVFVVTFLPAGLMANNLIPYFSIVFYMYFANNIANPVIYSFMNKNFRDDCRKMFDCL